MRARPQCRIYRWLPVELPVACAPFDITRQYRHLFILVIIIIITIVIITYSSIVIDLSIVTIAVIDNATV